MRLTYIGVDNIPMVEPGDDVLALIEAGLASMGESLQQDDVIVIAQKIISKSENRYLDLNDVEPGEEALRLGKEIKKIHERSRRYWKRRRKLSGCARAS